MGKTCDICGAKAGLLGGFDAKNGRICTACLQSCGTIVWNQLSTRTSEFTVEQFRAAKEFHEENMKYEKLFKATGKFDGADIDSVHKVIHVKDGSKLSKKTNDYIPFDKIDHAEYKEIFSGAKCNTMMLWLYVRDYPFTRIPLYSFKLPMDGFETNSLTYKVSKESTLQLESILNDIGNGTYNPEAAKDEPGVF